MSTPPRRRRTEGRRSRSGGGGWLPTVALGLGVIVAGLGIGALVAVLMQRDTGKTPPVAMATSTPASLSAPTQPPVAIATIEPPHTPRPSPWLPTPASNVSASREPVPTAPPSARTLAPATATPAATPAASVTAAPSPITLASVAPTGLMTSVPVAAVTPPASATSAGIPAEPTTTPIAQASAGPPAAYTEHASAVVRRYLNALIRGDEKTAFDALGMSAGAPPGALAEQAFLDAGARIVSLKVTRIDASNASVGCEIASAKGRYYATYHVTAASSGPYISQHDYIKV